MTPAQELLNKLPEDWEAKFLGMYDEGCSDWEIMREYGIKPKEWTLMHNALGESQFAEVVEYGNALCRAWWEQLGRTSLNTRGFNTRLYDIQMQNRFGWSQKAENTENDTGVQLVDIDSIDRRIAELTGKDKVSGDAETS